MWDVRYMTLIYAALVFLAVLWVLRPRRDRTVRRPITISDQRINDAIIAERKKEYMEDLGYRRKVMLRMEKGYTAVQMRPLYLSKDLKDKKHNLKMQEAAKTHVQKPPNVLPMKREK